MGVLQCWPGITCLVTWCDPVLGGYHLSTLPTPLLLFFFLLYLGPCLRTDGS